MRTQVGIVGAGPAGLMLSHLLHLAGISSIIVEDRSRAYCEARVRAGLMEHWVAHMLIDTGVGAACSARRWCTTASTSPSTARRAPSTSTS